MSEISANQSVPPGRYHALFSNPPTSEKPTYLSATVNFSLPTASRSPSRSPTEVSAPTERDSGAAHDRFAQQPCTEKGEHWMSSTDTLHSSPKTSEDGTTAARSLPRRPELAFLRVRIRPGGISRPSDGSLGDRHRSEKSLADTFADDEKNRQITQRVNGLYQRYHPEESADDLKSKRPPRGVTAVLQDIWAFIPGTEGYRTRKADQEHLNMMENEMITAFEGEGLPRPRVGTTPSSVWFGPDGEDLKLVPDRASGLAFPIDVQYKSEKADSGRGYSVWPFISSLTSCGGKRKGPLLTFGSDAQI